MSYTNGLDDPSAYFQTNLHSGDGGTGQTLTFDGNSDLQLDLHWGKCRSEGGREWQVIDTVRGITKGLTTVTTAVEYTDSTYVTAIGSNGYSIGQNNDNNKAGETYVSYNWKAGGSTSTNTDGNLDTTVSVNATAGFSIVKYVGEQSATQTFGHGLNAVPKMILLKKLDNATADWVVYHEAITSANRLKLNTTDASASSPNWRATPTSSVFNSNSSNIINNSGDSYIAYVFAEKQGYSKIGSYTGNGNADGTFVYTGFKVGWVMHKRTDSTNNWIIQDNKRVGYNANNPILKANTSDAEQAVHEMDFVSNGFKIRTTGAGSNASGGTYIYMAFAENPFVTSTGVCATAR